MDYWDMRCYPELGTCRWLAHKVLVAGFAHLANRLPAAFDLTTKEEVKLSISKNRESRRHDKLPPSAPLPAFLQTLACRLAPLAYVKQCQKRLGDTFVVHPIDMPPLVFVTRPSEIKAVLGAPATVLHPGVGAAVTRPLFGETSFMLMEEEAHMRVRGAITPVFHRKVVEEHVGVVDAIVRNEIRSWPVNAGFPSHHFLRALTLKVVLRSIFGPEDDLVGKLHRHLLDMLSVTASIVLQEPRMRYLPGWRGTWRRFVRRRMIVDELVFELIRRRLAQAVPAGHGDVLEALLATPRQDGSPMTLRELRDNLVSTIVAGHETTASALAWAFQFLAHGNDAQERLIAEIDGQAGEEYLTATIQEILRHSPVFLFAVPRAVVDSFELGGWTYRSPAQLLACTYLLHHDPELYPEPELFCPERFIGSSPQPRIWLPWGGGRKVCVGRHLATIEMRSVLREVFRQYALQPAGGGVERPHWRSVMLAPHAGSRVVLCPRRGLRRVQPMAPASEGATV